MAITVVETFATWSPAVTIIASDIDTEVLETAKRGIYPAERVSRIDNPRLERYFLKSTEESGPLVQVKEEIRRLVSFRQVNLLQPQWPVRAPLDAIFCRNVMIYFDRDTQLKVLRRFAPLLHPDGLLYAGHSERFSHAEDCFRLRGKTVYELAPAWRKGKAP
jgi:chemotaxis protein methyltransferase CheR